MYPSDISNMSLGPTRDGGHNDIMLKGNKLFSTINLGKVAYLVMLYNALYAFEEPFKHFSKYLSYLISLTQLLKVFGTP
jgi:hypothetical protein